MNKVLSWIVNLIPQEYRVGIAIKKVSYTVGKLAVAALAYGKMKALVGDNLTPDQLVQIQTTTAAIAAALLEGVHDWARLKYPNATWL